ncbi:cytochrome P450 [Nocardia sp. NPDC052254]|uniref:cytochrome P450 n=1 Tax=Nocardia sp. NPDC052254 TaxID=3155681 RepID=UPI00341CD79E
MNSPQQTQSLSDGTSKVDHHVVNERVAIYTEDFARQPHAYYDYMRQKYGTLAPIWIDEDVPATLVIDYETAKKIQYDSSHFRSDPRAWQQNLTDRFPGRRFDFLPMVEWRPNALRSNGDSPEHQRYRAATNFALDGIDQFALINRVEEDAHDLINSFCVDGASREKPLDLIKNYIDPLSFRILNMMHGSNDVIMAQIAKASADLFEGQDTAETNAQFGKAFGDLITLKREELSYQHANQLPLNEDIVSRFIRHPSELSDEEIAHQLVTCLSAGTQLISDLASSAMVLLLRPTESGLPLSNQAAVNAVRVNDPPLANYLITYPTNPINLDGVWLPANEPILISMAACMSDPQHRRSDQQHAHGDLLTVGWNISGGIGPHQCPGAAQNASNRIVDGILSYIFDIVPEIELAVPPEYLEYRQGPFARGLKALPVTFPPTPAAPLNR